MSRHLTSRILRIGLEEVVGERCAPDLTDKILGALTSESIGSSSEPRSVSQDVQRQADAVAAAFTDLQSPKPSRPAIARSSKPVKRNAKRQRNRLLMWGALAAMITVVVGTATAIAIFQATQPLDIAESVTPGQLGSEAGGLSDRSPAPSVAASTPGAHAETPQVEANEQVAGVGSQATEISPESPVNDSAGDSTGSANAADSVPSIAQNSDSNSVAPDRSIHHAQANGPVASWSTSPAPTSSEVLARLNSGMKSQWVAASVTPAAEISDREWADRTFQVILGRRPDAYEAAAFEIDTPVDRQAWANRLLTDAKYRPAFAKNWAKLLSNSLLDRRSSNRHLIAPDSFESMLAERLDRGEGLDQLTFDLITASGGLSPLQIDFNPAVSFLVALDNGRGVSATQFVLERFLGQNARCASCHDSSGTGELTQLEFWQTNAHLRQVAVQGDQEVGLRLVDVDFVGDAGDADRAAVFFETSERQLAAAFPRYSQGIVHPESGRLEQFDRRQALGAHVIADDRFPETWVDWVWTQAFEYPLSSGTNAGDSDLTLQATLAQDFASAGFHLDHLLLWIVLSDAFSRGESDAAELAVDRPWNGTPALFAHRYPARYRFESVNDALAALNAAYEVGPNEVLALRAGTSGDRQTLPNQEGIAANLGPGQAIDWQTATGWNASEATEQQLNRIVTSQLSAKQKFEHLFLLATGNLPNERDWHRCEGWLNKSAEPLAVYQDIWFALTRSAEAR